MAQTIPELKELSLIVIDNDLEALALRSALEWWGVTVHIHFIGKSQDIVDLFKSEKLSQNICIAAHGDFINNQSIFHLGELSDAVAKAQPYNKYLSSSHIAEFVKLKGQNVVSNACMTGSPDMASAFLNNGAASYIAPKDAPFGNSSLYFLLNYYFWLFVKEKSVKEAFDKAISMIDEELDKFSLFEKV